MHFGGVGVVCLCMYMVEKLNLVLGKMSSLLPQKMLPLKYLNQLFSEYFRDSVTSLCQTLHQASRRDFSVLSLT